ncbi:sensor histidine kinase [Neobacillus sp. SAB-20_R2A]|uniref:sensor histidine kinase n=1 Tax=Neobacillus sp. SAB-20_R2A TaxID=3120519 RepID=UPI003C6E72BA
MKIGSKLLLSYFILIISIFLITSFTFHFLSQRYLLKETEVQLKKEAKVISQILSRSSFSSEAVREKLMNRRALAVTERLMSSKMIIWTRNRDIIYSDLRGVSLDDVLGESKGPGRNFVSESLAVTSKNGKTIGYVTLVARLDEVQKVNRLMRRSQLFSLLISAVIAVVLGFIFQKGLTRPLRNLTEHMKNFSLRGRGQEIRLNSADEIGELADSFNALSRKLKQYDEEQKVFFQNASHELKTPLMAIQGNAEGILDGVVKGEDINKSLNVIIAESQRLKRIVEGITYLAKLENVEDCFKFQEWPLEQLIQEAVESVAALAEKRGVRIMAETGSTGLVKVDQEKLKRALINLLGNAIRYAESEVRVKAAFMGEDYGRKLTLVMEVRDDGPGFASGEVEKVFQRFYSGDTGGSGIGLAITKAIVEGHGGSIVAFNGELGGAVFRITLPEME